VIGDGVFTPAISGNFTRTNFSTSIEQASWSASWSIYFFSFFSPKFLR
jgi:uncharacterized membrane protein YoaK (UPF0700 family)